MCKVKQMKKGGAMKINKVNKDIHKNVQKVKVVS